MFCSRTQHSDPDILVVLLDDLSKTMGKLPICKYGVISPNLELGDHKSKHPSKINQNIVQTLTNIIVNDINFLPAIGDFLSKVVC